MKDFFVIGLSQLENQYTREMGAFKRRLLWDGCSNTRHLGGLVTEDQHVTNDALVRSDNLIKLTSAGQTALVADGVTTVIDLRFFGELEKNPNPLATSNWNCKTFVVLLYFWCRWFPVE